MSAAHRGGQVSVRAPGGLFTSRKEVESDDGFEHALVLFCWCSVSAAFLAEHAPCLEVGDGVFDGGADFAERGVELGLAGGQLATGSSFDGDDLNALDSDVAQVCGGGDGGELGGEA